MALDDNIIDEVASILTSYFLDGGADLAATYGDQAPSLAAEMGALLEERLNSDTPFGQLWYEYKENPVEIEAELIGALEVLEEADPELGLRLKGYYAAFQELDQPGVRDIIETSEPEAIINADEILMVNSSDDYDNDDDEYRDDGEYLRGNIEDHSTSAMYYEGQDPSIEPNQSEER
jgi:hypothetical protein